MGHPIKYVEIKPNLWLYKTEKGKVYVTRHQRGWWEYKAIPAARQFNKRNVTGRAQSYQGAVAKGTRELNKFLF